MNKNIKISENFKSRTLFFLTLLVSLYVALVTCLPFRASCTAILLTTLTFTVPISIIYQEFKNVTLKNQGKQKPIPFQYFFLTNITIFLIYLYAFYPGSIQFDCIHQWQQAHGTVALTDWHPAIHTLFIRFFSKIYDSYAFVVLCQSIIFSWINSSLHHEISKMGFSSKIVKFSFLMSIVSPSVCAFMMTLMKDVAFSISILGLAEIFLLTYFSRGSWIDSNKKAILLGLTLALATLFRHNGILFTLPFCVVMMVYFIRNKFVIRAFLIAILAIIFIKHPMYSYFNVRPHPQPGAEVCGMPMAVLGKIFVENPSVLDTETEQFLSSIADRKVWKDNYENGSWNSIKRLDRPNMQKDPSLAYNGKISKFGTLKVWTKAFQAGLKSQNEAVDALIDLTGLAWKIDPNADKSLYISAATAQNLSKRLHYLIDQEREISSLKKIFNNDPIVEHVEHDSELKGILQQIIIWISILLYFVFWRPGIYTLTLILASFISFHRLGWRSFCLVSPILIYTFSTMCLLCGSADYRYFLFMSVITIPYVILLFADRRFTKNEQMDS